MRPSSRRSRKPGWSRAMRAKWNVRRLVCTRHAGASSSRNASPEFGNESRLRAAFWSGAYNDARRMTGTANKTLKIGIVGGTGYTGVELLRLLAQHPHSELGGITSRQEAGTPG